MRPGRSRASLRAALDGRHPLLGVAPPEIATLHSVTTAITLVLDTMLSPPSWASTVLFVLAVGAVAVFAAEYRARLVVAPQSLAAGGRYL
ncbi:MAG: hypothetical protein AAF577_12955 [Pseudomonadota bacterium]